MGVRDSIMREWCREMIQAFREVNSNHMLSLGSEGFYSSSSNGFDGEASSANVNPFSDAGTWGVDFIEDSKGFDFLTVHLWVDDWLDEKSEEDKLRFSDEWIRQHVRDAEALGLPILFEEFGKKKPMSVRASFYERVYELATEATVALVKREEGMFEQKISLSPSAWWYFILASRLALEKTVRRRRVLRVRGRQRTRAYIKYREGLSR